MVDDIQVSKSVEFKRDTDLNEGEVDDGDVESKI